MPVMPEQPDPSSPSPDDLPPSELASGSPWKFQIAQSSSSSSSYVSSSSRGLVVTVGLGAGAPESDVTPVAGDGPEVGLPGVASDAPLTPADLPGDVAPVPPGAVAGLPTGSVTPEETPGSVVMVTGAPGAIVVVARSTTELALRLPTDSGAPEARIPTFAATAPVAAVTSTAVAPANVRARCLFMNRNLRAPSEAETPRRVKVRQSHRLMYRNRASLSP